MMSPGEFKQYVLDRAEEIGVQPKELHIRPMKRKLASCSSRGRLTFDVSLLEDAAGKRLEAVVHELLHLRYPNHGKMFNALLKMYLGRGDMRRTTVG